MESVSVKLAKEAKSASGSLPMYCMAVGGGPFTYIIYSNTNYVYSTSAPWEVDIGHLYIYIYSDDTITCTVKPVQGSDCVSRIKDHYGTFCQVRNEPKAFTLPWRKCGTFWSGPVEKCHLHFRQVSLDDRIIRRITKFVECLSEYRVRLFVGRYRYSNLHYNYTLNTWRWR